VFLTAMETRGCMAKSVARKPPTRTPSMTRCGNQANLRHLQAKLSVGATNDPLEQEADAAADSVMRMADPKISKSAPPTLRRKCARCEVEEKKGNPLRRKSSGSATAEAAPSIVSAVLSSPGRALDRATQSFMGARFGTDFSDVRVHTDTQAAQSAASVDARAYTVGRNVVFGAGEYDPVGLQGRRLLAHELAHVVQQRSTPSAGPLRRQPKSTVPASKKACPPMERGEKEEAAKAKLSLVERIPQQEWLITGFPIGGSEISNDEAAKFIERIIRSLMKGHFVYVTGQDSLEVLGFSDCFAGTQFDNRILRGHRAEKFCAGVRDHFADTPKTLTSLIHSCEPAMADEYLGPNMTRAERAQNRSILIRRVATPNVRIQKGNETFPYDPDYGPSEAHCAAYSSSLARDILGGVYTKNAHCSCLVTPDEPHNNCVRNCLQDKMWTMLANASANRAPGDPPMDINFACPMIWRHHRECYHDCGCDSEFIGYPAFDAVCNIPLPCAVDSAAINLLNRCMPAKKSDKYLPVDR